MSRRQYWNALLGFIVIKTLFVTTHSNENPDITDKPTPDPDPITLYKPRLGENVTLSVIATGEPTFYWTHNGSHVNSTDHGNSSDVTIEHVTVEDFGEYVLNMSNSNGSTIITYMLKPDGPPQPVSGLNVNHFSVGGVYVNFTTGYDYNDTQTFLIVEYNDSKPTELASCNDTTTGHGGDEFMCPVQGLQEDIVYTITVISKNSRNESVSNSSVTFTSWGAPKPDPAEPLNDTLKPRLDQLVNLTIHAVGCPAPTYNWTFNGQVVKSSDSDYSSTVTIDHMAVENFGDFTLNMTSLAGNYINVYKVIADGPPQAVSKLHLSNFTDSAVDVGFQTGYDYNDTQTFQIVAFNMTQFYVLTSCNDTTSGHGGNAFTCPVRNLTEDIVYNITVISINSRGQTISGESVAFTSYGRPLPDPSRPVNTTAKPRLQDNITMTMHAVGYPPPTYQWEFNGTVVNSTDSNYTSTVTIENMRRVNFGDYILTMSNAAGNYTVKYDLVADGPPDPVKELKVSYIKSDSVQLAWQPGYDYKNEQTFKIYGAVNNGAYQLLKENIKDTTGGGSSASNETFTLTSLKSSSTYTVYVTAMNKRGDAMQQSNHITFKTADGGSTKKRVGVIVGSVVGGVAAVVLIVIVVISVRRRLKRKSDSSYERLNDDQSANR